MATAEELQTRINAIDETLDSGMTSTNVDGMAVSIDHDNLRRRRAELQAELDAINSPNTTTGGPFRRVQL